MEFYVIVFSSKGPCPLKNLEPPLKKLRYSWKLLPFRNGLSCRDNVHNETLLS